MDPTDPNSAVQQGGGSLGLPDLQTPPTPFTGAALPVQGPNPGVVTIDQVLQLLRDDRLRGFKIDVETDTLIEADQAKEKAQRTEFVQSVGEFIAKAGPIAQAMPPLAPLIGGLLQFAVRGFKVGQELEELIESSMHKAGMLLENPPPKPPPPEEMAKLQGIQAKTQAEMAKAQADLQMAQIEAQGKVAQLQAQMQATDQKHAADLQAMSQKHEMEMTRMAADMQNQREKHQMEVHKHGLQMQQAAQSHDLAMTGKQADIEGKKQTTDAKVNAKAGKTAEGKPNEVAQIAEAVKALHEHISAPKKVVRDANGRVIGVEVAGKVKHAKRDASGRVTDLG